MASGPVLYAHVLMKTNLKPAAKVSGGRPVQSWMSSIMLGKMPV